MMSLTVLVGTLCLLPSPPLPFPSLAPPASLYLSISVVMVRKSGSGRKEERQRRKKKKEEEDDNEGVKQLYANQNFPLDSVLPFTTAGTLYSLLSATLCMP